MVIIHSEKKTTVPFVFIVIIILFNEETVNACWSQLPKRKDWMSGGKLNIICNLIQQFWFSSTLCSFWQLQFVMLLNYIFVLLFFPAYFLSIGKLNIETPLQNDHKVEWASF